MREPAAYTPARMEIRTIIVPLDGSDLSERALGPALTIAERFGARVVLVQAIPSLGTIVAQTASDASDTTAYIDPYEIQDSVRTEAQRALDAARAKLAPLTAQVEIFEGRAADGILALAERERADLVVMGTRGKGGIARAVLGSVADTVMHRTRCPVLLVPPEARI